jgi:murein DD-endopeptidase MepM/ murein hydrolase activator NlpD
MNKHTLVFSMVGVMLLLAACRQTPQSCPEVNRAGAGTLNDLVAASAPIQFPVDPYIVAGQFTSYANSSIFENKYHAAEDIMQTAGSPVYAMADGNISYSGKKDGYGWLVIIDHSQAKTYSLYGHLSPSRWARERGEVKQGELIGYIGDGDENGYNNEVGWIEPHLHFAVRLGKRSNYSGNGDQRWMAGWTYACPEELGWLHPSWFITAYAEEGAAIVADNPNAPTFFNRIDIPVIAYGAAFGIVFGQLFTAVRRRMKGKQSRG